jgi:hypothetical protein
MVSGRPTTVFASSARQWTLQPSRYMKFTRILTGEVYSRAVRND